MTSDQLRRYIADAEATPQILSSSEDWATLRMHQSNANPKVFAALCRLAVAAMEWRAVTKRERPEGWMPYGEAYDAALHTLENLP